MKKSNKSRKSSKPRQKFDRDPARGSKPEGSTTEQDGSKNPFNDISWYSRNPSLLLAAGQIPYPYRPGMNIPIWTTKFSTGNLKVSMPLPGFLALNYDISIGRSSSVVDPASIVSKEMYGKVRAAFSGSLPEDPPDLFIYLMALDSVYNQIAEMKRLFRAIGAYSPENYTFPSLLIAALTGLDNMSQSSIIDTIISSKMKFFQYINELVGMVQKFTSPAIMHVIDRHYWLGDYIYADANSMNSQMYVFVNKYHYKFALDTEGKGMLKAIKFTFSGSKGDFIDQWYAHVRDMIESLASSEDAYTISGHLARAYEGERQFTVAPLAYNEVNIPQYIPEVLSQIENSRTSKVNVNSLDVTQNPNTNALVSNPTLAAAAYPDVVDFNNVISIRSLNPTVFDTVIASRLQSVVEGGLLLYPGTEVLESYTLYVTGSSPITSDSVIDSDAGFTTNDLIFISTLSRFDWSPFIYYYNKTTPLSLVFGDFHNTTSVSSEVMRNLNRICIYSEFGAFSNV